MQNANGKSYATATVSLFLLRLVRLNTIFVDHSEFLFLESKTAAKSRHRHITQPLQKHITRNSITNKLHNSTKEVIYVSNVQRIDHIGCNLQLNNEIRLTLHYRNERRRKTTQTFSGRIVNCFSALPRDFCRRGKTITTSLRHWKMEKS
jgi:hypothetical protein